MAWQGRSAPQGWGEGPLKKILPHLRTQIVKRSDIGIITDKKSGECLPAPAGVGNSLIASFRSYPLYVSTFGHPTRKT